MSDCTSRGLPGKRMTSASSPFLAKPPVSFAIHGADNPGAGETNPTRIFSAAEVSPVRRRKRHPATTTATLLISDLQPNRYGNLVTLRTAIYRGQDRSGKGSFVDAFS